jgi:hypothetical protein
MCNCVGEHAGECELFLLLAAFLFKIFKYFLVLYDGFSLADNVFKGKKKISP